MNPQPLTDAELDEIERLARTDAAEAYRGPLLALSSSASPMACDLFPPYGVSH